MGMRLVSWIVFSLALYVSAKPLQPRHSLHEKRSYTPAGWTRSARHEPSARFPLRFGLAQSNTHNIDDFLYDVAHPDSPNYGKHWTPSQVAETFAPVEDTIATVRNWLLESGFDESRVRLTSSRAWIEVDATVEEAENLLLTEYHIYGHESGAKHVACDEYHLPEHIVPHVEMVTPTVHFNVPMKRSAGGALTPTSLTQKQPKGITFKNDIKSQSNASDLSTCDQLITPDCLRALYDFNYEPTATSQNSIGIVEFSTNYYYAPDIDLFASNFSAGLTGKRPKLVSIDGGTTLDIPGDFNDNGQGNIDLQYSMVLVTPAQEVTLFQNGEDFTGGNFDSFLDAIDGSFCTYEGGDLDGDPTWPDGVYNGTRACGTVQPTNIISNSYIYYEAALGSTYSTRQCNEYAKLGLMGVTMIFTSSYDGVTGFDQFCLTNSQGHQYFDPIFPSSCPYVTSIGSTMLPSGAAVTDPEVALSSEGIYLSGGGFSNYFPVPDYQQSTVANYLKKYPPPYTSDIFNASGRAFPDISASALNFALALNGQWISTLGPSNVVVASILAMVNDARLSAGKGPIGFINPTIYSSDFDGAFNDITSGNNPGCGTDGFSATPGWDPVTGLGTPNFPRLVEKWLALP